MSEPLKPYVPPSDESIIDSLPVHDHLGLTEENLIEICRGLWDCDPVIQRHRDRQAQFAISKQDYFNREQTLTAQIDAGVEKIDQLKVEIRKLDTQRRETKGAINSLRYHSQLADVRIREAEVAVTKRKQQLYLSEAQKRLTKLGKQLKMGRGARALSGKSTEVVPINENKEAQ